MLARVYTSQCSLNMRLFSRADYIIQQLKIYASCQVLLFFAIIRADFFEDKRIKEILSYDIDKEG
jgi:hypothetical protein